MRILLAFLMLILYFNPVFSATEKEFIPVEEVQESLKFADEPENVQRARIRAFKNTPLPPVILEKYKTDSFCSPKTKTRPYPIVDNDHFRRQIVYFSDKAYVVFISGEATIYYYDYDCNLIGYGRVSPYSLKVAHVYNINNELQKIFVFYKYKLYHFKPDGTLVGYWKFSKKYSPDGKNVIMTSSKYPIY